MPSPDEAFERHKAFKDQIQEYKEQFPDVDWTTHEITWGFDNQSIYGIKIVGHDLINQELRLWFQERQKECCCHPKGCPLA